MAGRLHFTEGFFDLEDGQALVGAELARRLGLRVGDEITLYSIPAIFSAADYNESPDEDAGLRAFTVTGIFETGFYEYDTGWVFVEMESASAFTDKPPILGLKIKNRFQDHKMLELARKCLEQKGGFKGAQFSSWRDYNRSFFGALRTEKLFMFILVGLIFIVVGLNIYQSQRRAVLEHREDIGLLRALGGGEQAVRLVFVCDGAIIGFTGAGAGLGAGLLIASHIQAFFTLIEKIVNFFIGIINALVGFTNAGELGGFSIFSPAVFYCRGIPSRIIPGEAAMIFLFGFFSALAAAWFASRNISRIKPAEVLRYE
jgi:lipoprotein-releasing system permease protein